MTDVKLRHPISLTFLFWISQIRLLKILALLGSGDKHASENMYTVLGDIFRKGDSSSNIGNAILYECICCVSSIYPSSKLLDAAAEITSKFLKVWFATFFFSVCISDDLAFILCFVYFTQMSSSSFFVLFLTMTDIVLIANISCKQSESHNLKYMGIDALGRLIKINPDIAEEHQLAVIDCLEVRIQNGFLTAYVIAYR